MGTPMRVLVVEDEKKLAGFIKQALKEDGHVIDLCHDGDEAAQLAGTESYDAIVLDLQLPGRDGLMVLRDLRKNGKTTPVLILTARDTVKDRVKGLDEGADDYLAKPFALDELRARLRALFRRGSSGGTSILKFADLSMNLIDRLVLRGTREIELTAKEFSLLEYFLRNARKALTRSSIAEHVWDFNFEWQSNVLEVFVNALRKKTEAGGEPRLVHTVRGVGYVLKEDDGADG